MLLLQTLGNVYLVFNLTTMEQYTMATKNTPFYNDLKSFATGYGKSKARAAEIVKAVMSDSDDALKAMMYDINKLWNDGHWNAKVLATFRSVLSRESKALFKEDEKFKDKPALTIKYDATEKLIYIEYAKPRKREKALDLDKILEQLAEMTKDMDAKDRLSVAEKCLEVVAGDVDVSIVKDFPQDVAA